MKYFDTAPILTDDDNIQFKGVAVIPNFEQYKSKYKIHTITKSEEFRPDIVSFNLYNDDNFSWVIDALNGFINGISEYEVGTEIYYLDKDILSIMGIS